MNPIRTPALTRRSALLGLTGAITLGRASLALAAAPTQSRFVVVILRGALDGMAAVVPYGDPALTGLRGAIVPPRPGEPDGMLDLGGFYGLHPALTGLHEMYKANELLPVHAIAGPSRSRSHFEAQDYLESGADHRMTSGWLNRAVLAMGPAANPAGNALAVGVSVPLLLRGPAMVGSWAPESFAKPAPDLYARIVALQGGDAVTGPAFREGLRERGFSAETLGHPDPAMPVSAAAIKERYAFPALATAAGRMLAARDGPRVAALELGGWDTHSNQGNRLQQPLSQLDAGLVALKSGLGEAWRQTAVLVMTEFGRTARVNGTKGTDHGTGGVAFLLGGAVAGGKVMADWPGLGPGRLLEDRDLQPTADLRAVAKAVLAGHLGIGAPALRPVFPGADAIQPARGVLRT